MVPRSGKSVLALSSVALLAVLLLSASVVPVVFANNPVVIKGHGLMNLHGKVVKTLRNGQQYIIFCILSDTTSKPHNFNVLFSLDGSLFEGNGGGINPHSSVLVGTGSLKAVTGLHTVEIDLCTDSSCTAFLQTVSFQFTVT